MALPLIGDDVVHLGPRTYMWVQLTHFTIDPDQEDSSLLESLTESPGYQHDYASPFPRDGSSELRSPGIHGRWILSAINRDLFEATTADEAKAGIQSWANEQDWTDLDYSQPPEVMQQLEAVYLLLDSGPVYKLRNPGPEAEHDYGFVTGSMGFHEFIVIDRKHRTLHVIVASDD